MEVIPFELFEGTDNDLFLPLHPGMEMIAEEDTRLRSGFKPRTILSLGLGSNPIINPTSERLELTFESFSQCLKLFQGEYSIPFGWEMLNAVQACSRA